MAADSVHRDFDLRVCADVEQAIRTGDVLTLRHFIENRFGIHNKRHTMCLYQAIGQAHLVMVKMLLDAGVDRDYFEVANEVGVEASPLHRALDVKDSAIRWKIIKLLLESGVSAKNEHLYRQSCLFKAIELGDCEMVRVLFVAGAKVNCSQYTVSRGFSPLHAALQWLDGQDCIKMVRLLIEIGADVEAADTRGFSKTCLHLVPHVKSGSCEVLELLLDAGAYLDHQSANGSTPLSIATSLGKIDLMRRMIAAGADVNLPRKVITSPIYSAIFKHDRDALQLLLESGADTNTRREFDSYFVLWAAEFGRDRNKTTDFIGILKILLNHGTQDPYNRTGNKMLFQSVIRHGTLNAMHLFFESGATLQNYGVSSPLHLAAQNDSKDILKYLLRNCSYDVDQIYDEDHQVCTALDKAVCAHRRDNVRLLIEWGANVNILSVVDRVSSVSYNPVSLITSPLYSAVVHRDRKTVDLLLSQGAKINTNFNRESWERIVRIVVKPQHRKILVSLIGEVALFRDRNIFDRSNERNEDFLMKTLADMLPEIVECCQAELEILKTLTFFGPVTLYDLLRGKDVTRYVKNSQVINTFRSQAVVEFFPVYGSRIECCYTLAKVKREVMDEATCKLNRMLQYRFTHHHEILYTIGIYLSLKDLRNLCKVSNKNDA